MASKHKSSFALSIANLTETCSDKSKVEILVKIDIQSDIEYYEDILKKYHFKHEVIYSPVTGYLNIGDFHNDLALRSKGEIIWMLTDDFFVKHGDWVAALHETRNVYPDNIYAVYVPFHAPKWFSLAPALSREWVQCLGYFTYGFQADYWVAMIARDVVDRYIHIPADKLVMRHVRTDPIVDKKTVKKLHVRIREQQPIVGSKLRNCMKGTLN